MLAFRTVADPEFEWLVCGCCELDLAALAACFHAHCEFKVVDVELVRGRDGGNDLGGGCRYQHAIGKWQCDVKERKYFASFSRTLCIILMK